MHRDPIHGRARPRNARDEATETPTRRGGAARVLVPALAAFAIAGCVARADEDTARAEAPARSLLDVEWAAEPILASQGVVSSPPRVKGDTVKRGPELVRALAGTRDGVTATARVMLASGWGSWSEWSEWCEPAEVRSCETDDDCAANDRCITPWWARKNGEDVQQCIAKWPSLTERSYQRERLRTVVNLMCSRGDGCDPARLHEFLSLIAVRESTWRPYKRHRLNADVVAARGARERRRRVYTENLHFDQDERWASALGLYGQNPAIFVDAWHRSAPPEVLCREVESTAAYLERARRAVRGFRRRGLSPTLCDVHRAVSGGKLEKCDGDEGSFARRARQHDIDPNAPVDEASFGAPPPTEIGARLAWADAVRSAVEAKHPRSVTP